MPPSSDTSYIPLADDEENQHTPIKPGIGFASQLRNYSVLWGSIIVLQSLVILILLWRRNGSPGVDVPYLYSPAEGAVRYELRSFFFGIGEDMSPFQKPPSTELDDMWEDLYSFGIHRIPKREAAKLPNKTSQIPNDPEGFYIAELEVFHQLHCLNMVRQALYPDHYPTMRMGNPKTNEHINHCVDAIRQSLMCSADISTIVWQWDEVKQRTTFRGGVTHKCRNFGMIQKWAKARKMGGHFDATVKIEDDIRIPLYREDGTTYIS